MLLRLTPFALLAIAIPGAAHAQEREPLRTRIYLGPQLSPKTPGAKDLSFGPFFDVSRARGDDPFDFEAPDESFGFPVADAGGIEFGPALGFKGKRKAADIGVPLHEVGFSFEIGAFAQTYLAPELRIRAEGRKAVSGHRGWVGEVGADYVAREGDDWLFSIGPRVTLADAEYHRAWYGITPADSVASGLATFRPGGGVEAVGISAGYLRQLTPSLGFAAYARYDRLVGDAAKSPYVRAAGSRSQPSLGLALSYTFARR
ncbi:MipA/OmpV family protein [Sphingomonas suaedae]|uniref:MipA/OmpV family protein n=1 Tax=Sphingomonas suaedae TaxID=2599297 RepID=A0A518RKF1_9SPHN|nr:MipA/OmpV family protein [Sphingomonas suaedae]QDX27915.1 MipA/OmpV family protein [Sphingomonas suaedae]